MKKKLALLFALIFYVSILPPLSTADVIKGNFSDIITKGPWVDVRAFGILPTNTAAQNVTLLNALFASLTPGSDVYFPAGTYLIDNTLTMTNLIKMRFRGAGFGSGDVNVKIRWSGNGDNTATMLDLSGCRRLIFENIGFYGNSTDSTSSSNRTNIGVYQHVGGTQSNGIFWHGCEWNYFNVGYQNGHLTNNESGNELGVLDHCFFSYNGIGYRQHWPNNLMNRITGGGASFNGVGYDLVVGSGSAFFYGQSFSYNDIDIRNNNIGGNIFNSLRTEGAKQFMVSSSGTATGGANTLINPQVVVCTSGCGAAQGGASSEPFIATGAGPMVVIGGYLGTYVDKAVTVGSNISPLTLIGTIHNNPDLALDNASTANNKIITYGVTYWDNTLSAVYSMADGTKWNTETVAMNVFTNTDNTPKVTSGNYFRTNSPGPAVITNFTGGYVGQIITVVCTDNTTTINHSASIFLKAGTNYTCITNNIKQFLRVYNGSSLWVEIGG